MNTIAPKLSPLPNEDFVSSYVCYMMHERAKATEDVLKLCIMVYNDFQVNTLDWHSYFADIERRVFSNDHTKEEYWYKGTKLLTVKTMIGRGGFSRQCYVEIIPYYKEEQS